MPLKAPTIESPYLPVQGVNWDANGLSIKPDECADILNFRITQKELVTRSGTKRLALNAPDSNPILWMHTYKQPNGSEMLFGFTKRGIYQYNVATSSWEVCLGDVSAIPGTISAVLDNCDAVGTWATTLPHCTLVVDTTYKYIPTGALFLSLEEGYTLIMGNHWVLASNVPTTAWDLTGSTHISMWMMYWWKALSAIGTLNLHINFYSNTNFTGLIESFDTTVTGVAVGALDYTKITLKLTDPTAWTSVKSMNITANGAQGFDGYLYLDYICNEIQFSSDLTFWHTTDYIDSTVGATVVAAGSCKPKPEDPEDDGSKRVLLYYDPTTAIWKSMSLMMDVAVVKESTGVTCGGVGTQISTKVLQATGFSSIGDGTCIFFTVEDGDIATASGISSTIGGKTGNYLVPSDVNKIERGVSSFVATEPVTASTTWSIKFLADTYSGHDLFVKYTYRITSAYKPRYVWNFHNRVIYANTFETPSYYPWRIRASVIGNLDLLDALDYWDLIDTDVTPIVGGDYQGYYLNILKQGCIVKGSYVGEDLVFSFDTVWKNGTYAGRTLQTYQDKQYFLGDDDIYVWDGASRKSLSLDAETGAHRVRDRIFGLMNRDKINNCFGSLFPKYHEYWLWIVKAGETYPKSVFVYSILRNIWYYFEFDPTITVGYFHIKPATATIADLVGTIAEQAWTFEGAALEGLQAGAVLAYAAGDTYIVDDLIGSDGGKYNAGGTWVPGTICTMRLVTRDFIFSDIPHQERVNILDFEAYGTSIDVKYCKDYNVDYNSFTTIQTNVSLTHQYKKYSVHPDAVIEHVRFAFQSAYFTAIRWIIPYAITERLHNV